LLVEEELHVRELARQVLESCGYTVIAAADGPEAVVSATSHTGPVHLLVAGRKLPHGMDGPRLAGVLRSRFAALPALFVTETNEAGEGFLQKPYTPTALARKVRDTLDAKPG
jgi:two-component system, cell cycle sensor histidine kinase and response regulator CckA